MTPRLVIDTQEIESEKVQKLNVSLIQVRIKVMTQMYLGTKGILGTFPNQNQLNPVQVLHIKKQNKQTIKKKQTSVVHATSGMS